MASPSASSSDPSPNPGPTLVLGASGFLGAHVLASAVVRARSSATFAEPLGEGVVGVSRDPAAAPRFCDPRDAAEWVTADLSREGAAAELLEGVRPARVLCCAALARAADCEQDPSRAERLNRDLPGDVARWCATRGVRFVHLSTDLVFGATAAPEGGFGEDVAAEPVSVYGHTKLAGEEAVLAAYPAALVVRLPLLYGNSGGRGLGASDSLLEAVDRDERPGLFIDEWRTPMEVSNAADALVELAHGSLAGRLHVAGPDRVTRHALGLRILEAAGLEPQEARAEVRGIPQAEIATAAPRPRDVSLASERARRVLETPLLGVEAGTRRARR